MKTYDFIDPETPEERALHDRALGRADNWVMIGAWTAPIICGFAIGWDNPITWLLPIADIALLGWLMTGGAYKLSRPFADRALLRYRRTKQTEKSSLL